mgnify:CR=1 FL=1
MQTLKKTVARTYQLKDGWYYKVQYEYEETLDEWTHDIDVEYKAITAILEKQLEDEKKRLGLYALPLERKHLYFKKHYHDSKRTKKSIRMSKRKFRCSCVY